MTTYTDEQLKRALAKMLPDLVYWDRAYGLTHTCIPELPDRPVLNTELLYMCSMVEESLNQSEEENYYFAIDRNYRAPWQTRAAAAAKVKGVEII